MFNILLPQHLIFHAPPNSAQDELVGAVKIEEYLWLLTHPGENSKRGISIFRLGPFEQIPRLTNKIKKALKFLSELWVNKSL